MTPQEGGCLCGAQRYAVNQPPEALTLCHCRFCQRATDGTHMVEPIIDKTAFRMISGTPKVWTTRSEGSGMEVHVHFCDTCGTKTHLSFERFPDIVGVYAGTFDDPNWYDWTPENTKQIFLDVAQQNATVLPGIPCFTQHMRRLDGSENPSYDVDSAVVVGKTYWAPDPAPDRTGLADNAKDP
jgi:hypothetical protein